MKLRVLGRWTALVSIVVAVSACDDKGKGEAKPEVASTAAPAPSATVESTPAPGGCKAESEKPSKLATIHGYVYGFQGDATHLYFSSWQLYGSRGDVGRVRKDGEGKTDFVSLSLEPRGLQLDEKRVYYTAGIRLFAVPKEGGEPTVLHETFSSQGIAMDGTYIFGVPGDYGPYDRLVRVEKKGGPSKELDVATRPDVKEPPSGFSAIAVDASGVYVTDSGANRVLRFQLDRAKPKVLAAKQDKAYDLLLDDDNVYFTLAKAGKLMKVSKSGGAAKVMATGLENQTRIGGDAKAIYATFAAKSEDAPQTLVKIPLDGGDSTPVGVVPHSHIVEAVSVDEKCVYWAQRDPDTKNAVVYALARK